MNDKTVRSLLHKKRLLTPGERARLMNAAEQRLSTVLNILHCVAESCGDQAHLLCEEPDDEKRDEDRIYKLEDTQDKLDELVETMDNLDIPESKDVR